ncbi:MAG: transferase, partial [Clostridia bacterium]|nr:transferase [Clostridia bacterium]
MRDLVIIGAGGFGREVAWLVEEINRAAPTWRLLGFIDGDERKWGQVVNDYPVLGDFSAVQSLAPGVAAVCAVGDPAAI